MTGVLEQNNLSPDSKVTCERYGGLFGCHGVNLVDMDINLVAIDINLVAMRGNVVAMGAI